MGCTQSKTNEQEVVNPNVGPVEISVTPIEVSPDNTAEPIPIEVHELDETDAEPLDKEVSAVEIETPNSILQFTAGEVSINEYGVAFYNFDGTNSADPTRDIHVCKRYSEFKDMHAEISKIMVSEKNVKVEDQDKFQTYPALPAMPRANAVTYVLGRGNQAVVKEREARFVKILNAIARHPIALQSRAFNDFLA